MYDQIEITQTKERNGIPLLKLEGRLDASGAQRLRGICQDLREAGEISVVIDLAEVEFVASSGLGTFLLLTEEFRESGGSVIFAAPSPAVLDVVALLNLDQFLHMEETLDAALGAVEV